MTTIIAWIVVFGVLVSVHEFGHFIMAKSLKMRVNEFSLGFGPGLWKRRFGETVYAVRMLPLGGYVRLAGMEGDKTDDRREFPNRPLWQRFIVILAGPFMNLLLAAVLYAVLFGPVGIPVPSTIVGRTLPQFPAYTAGIRSGDRIVRINNTPINDWATLESTIRRHDGSVLRIVVARGKTSRTVQVRPKWDPVEKAYIIGIQPKAVIVHQGPLAALASGIGHTVQLTGMWFVALERLISGQGRFDLTGPVGIAVLVGQAAQAGLTPLLVLAAALSANLGLFNILPIPVLDGSRLFLLGVEGIRRKAIDPERESMIHLVGMVVLLVFVVFITYHDVVHYLHLGSSL